MLLEQPLAELEAPGAARRLSLDLAAVARSPWLVAATVLVVYGVWLLASFAAGHDARDFILLNRHRVEMSHRSPLIRYDGDYRPERLGNRGYDGQYAYFIALDPLNARYYTDNPGYRYERILYPVAARLLALGQPDAIPATLVLINFLALVGGTLALAGWLVRKAVTPWLALLYGFYPGLFLSLRHDLTEPLAFGLVAAAIFVLQVGGRRRLLLGSLVFALAVLTREEVAIFPLIYAGSLLLRRSRTTRPHAPGRNREAAVVAGVSLMPFLLWKIFLSFWLGSGGIPSNNLPTLLPFAGIARYWPWAPDQLVSVVAVVLPAVLCLIYVGLELSRRRWSVEVSLLVGNIVLFVLFLTPSSYGNYTGSGRVAAGVVLCGILCLPLLLRQRQPVPLWLKLVPVLWMIPWYHDGMWALRWVV